LIKAADNGCPICSVVRAGLTSLDGAIDQEYGVVFKVKPFGELRISYMKAKKWETRRKFEMYLARGKNAVTSATALSPTARFLCRPAGA
jgi:hypothetical protein